MNQPWAIGLTVAFAATGSQAVLMLFAELRRATPDPAAVLLHLNHATMSSAMIVMAWHHGGPVESAIQLMAFACFAGINLAASIAADDRPARLDALGHLVMNVAMAWMFVPMVGVTTTHSDHDHHAGVDTAASSTWWTPGTTAATFALSLYALWWAAQAIHSRKGRAGRFSHAAMAAAMAAMFLMAG